MIEGYGCADSGTVAGCRDDGVVGRWPVVVGCGLGVSLAVMFLFVLFAVTPALASFELVGEFKGNGNTELRKSEGAGGAVNDASGDVYIADVHNHRVERFSSTGGFLGAWGWGVVSGADEFQICVVETECGSEGISGSENGEFMSPQGIAVDQETGDVYVLDMGRTQGVVQEFSATGAYITSFGERGNIDAENIERPAGGRNDIAVGKGGNVYITDEGLTRGPRVMVFSSSGVYQSGQDIGVGTLINPGPVAADSLGHVLTIDGGCLVDKFEQSGVLAWHSEEACEKQSLAVDPTTGVSFFYSKSGNKFSELDTEGIVTEQFSGAPGEEFTTGLAYNPTAIWSAGRPPGLVYAVSFNENTEKDEVLIFSKPPVVPPSIDGESVSGVGTTTAVLKAQVDPHGNDTHYRFQYGSLGPCSSSSSECREAPASGEADLGSAQNDMTASVTLTGLEPGIVYHYRVLATNGAGTTAGLDETFTTFSPIAAGLPDGRVYELVSPSEKDGGEVFPPEPNGGSCPSIECKPGIDEPPFPMQSTPSGNAVVYEGYPFSSSGDAVGANEYLGMRNADGWQTQDLSLAHEKTSSKQGFEAFSSDLSTALLFEIEPALSAEAPVGQAPPHIPYANIYVQENATPGSVRPLITSPPPHRNPENTSNNSFEVFFAGASADFSHVIFEANDTLTANAVDGGVKGRNLYQWIDGQLSLVNVLTGGLTTGPDAVFGSGEELTTGTEGQDFSQAISEDGSRIFWTDQSTGHVYVRENNTTTTLIPDSGKFLTASADGSEVLLNDGHIYDLEQKALIDLTRGEGGFVGILGASKDLSHIYFTDTSSLNGEGVLGEDNLYLWDGGTTKFLTTLSAKDETTWFLSRDGTASDWAASLSHRTAQVTPDGRYLAFMSYARPTGYDNIDIVTGEPDAEVYEYDAVSNRLVCASCDPSGAQPIGSANLSLLKPGRNVPLPQPRNLAENGRLFFDSLDALSPLDVNGRVQDVYEYEPGGLGNCSQAIGCISLISSGRSSSDSNFVNATPNGSNVFFTTRERLVSQDKDSLLDLYDAREGGGFPAVAESVPCAGEACKGLSSTASVFGASSSAALLGNGNLGAPVPKVVVKSPPTRAQRLAAALKLCRKKTKKKQREVCEGRARKKYGSVPKVRKSKSRKNGRAGR